MKTLKLLAWSLLLGCLPVRARADLSESSFATPPDATKPRCYWYWMNGQITKQGITRDLEAMRRVGIGEAYIGMIDGQSKGPINPNLTALTTRGGTTSLTPCARGRGSASTSASSTPRAGASRAGRGSSRRRQCGTSCCPRRTSTAPRTSRPGWPRRPGRSRTSRCWRSRRPWARPPSARETRTDTEVAIEMPAPIVARSVTVKPHGLDRSVRRRRDGRGEGGREPARHPRGERLAQPAAGRAAEGRGAGAEGGAGQHAGAVRERRTVVLGRAAGPGDAARGGGVAAVVGGASPGYIFRSEPGGSVARNQD